MPTVVLIRGMNFRGGNLLFRRGVPMQVSQEVYDYLMRKRPPMFADVQQSFTYIPPSHIPKYVERGTPITVIRENGLGDVVIVSRSLLALQAKYPQIDLRYAVNPAYVPMFEGMPFPVESIPAIEGKRVVCDCRGYAERAHDRRTRDRNEVYLRYFNVWPCDDPAPTMPMTETEQERMRGQLIQLGRIPRKPLIGLCLRDSGVQKGLQDKPVNRTISKQQTLGFVDLAVSSGYQVALIDGKRIGWDAPGVLNTAGVFTTREVGALLSVCSVVVSPDTGIYHYSHALGVPTVVYFGKIDPRLRAQFYSRCSTIWHPQRPTCPCEYRPCATSDCLRAIRPVEIMEHVERWMGKTRQPRQELAVAAG